MAHLPGTPLIALHKRIIRIVPRCPVLDCTAHTYGGTPLPTPLPESYNSNYSLSTGVLTNPTLFGYPTDPWPEVFKYVSPPEFVSEPVAIAQVIDNYGMLSGDYWGPSALAQIDSGSHEVTPFRRSASGAQICVESGGRVILDMTRIVGGDMYPLAGVSMSYKWPVFLNTWNNQSYGASEFAADPEQFYLNGNPGSCGHVATNAALTHVFDFGAATLYPAYYVTTGGGVRALAATQHAFQVRIDWSCRVQLLACSYVNPAPDADIRFSSLGVGLRARHMLGPMYYTANCPGCTASHGAFPRSELAPDWTTPCGETAVGPYQYYWYFGTELSGSDMAASFMPSDFASAPNHAITVTKTSYYPTVDAPSAGNINAYIDFTGNSVVFDFQQYMQLQGYRGVPGSSEVTHVYGNEFQYALAVDNLSIDSVTYTTFDTSGIAPS